MPNGRPKITVTPPDDSDSEEAKLVVEEKEEERLGKIKETLRTLIYNELLGYCRKVNHELNDAAAHPFNAEQAKEILLSALLEKRTVDRTFLVKKYLQISSIDPVDPQTQQVEKQKREKFLDEKGGADNRTGFDRFYEQLENVLIGLYDMEVTNETAVTSKQRLFRDCLKSLNDGGFYNLNENELCLWSGKHGQIEADTNMKYNSDSSVPAASVISQVGTILIEKGMDELRTLADKVFRMGSAEFVRSTRQKEILVCCSTSSILEKKPSMSLGNFNTAVEVPISLNEGKKVIVSHYDNKKAEWSEPESLYKTGLSPRRESLELPKGLSPEQKKIARADSRLRQETEGPERPRVSFSELAVLSQMSKVMEIMHKEHEANTATLFTAFLIQESLKASANQSPTPAQASTTGLFSGKHSEKQEERIEQSATEEKTQSPSKLNVKIDRNP